VEETEWPVYDEFSSEVKRRMRYAQTVKPWRHYFNQTAALLVAILLLISACAAQAQATAAARPDPPWLQNVQKDPALLVEFGQLMTKLQHDIQFPPPRGQSRLLPLLPESTAFYAAFPNYGDASHQALTIFHQELQQSPVLRAWWQHGDLAANRDKVEGFLENVYQLSQFLGDEIVVAGETAGRQEPTFLILAEVRKPGLKDLLQQMGKNFGGTSKPAIRVLDVQELATATSTVSPRQLVILVRPDFVVAALDVAALRRFNARLDGKIREFVSTPFGQRVEREYQGGISSLGAIDLQKILQQVPLGTGKNRLVFERSGFADMKYLVWNRKTVSGQAESQMELSFTGPRHGVASWLAAPGPLGSLDFVSPKPILVSTVLLNDPAKIFDDGRNLSAVSNPKAFASVDQMEAALKLNFRDDLLRRLGGEITIEVDSLKPPLPAWKAIFQVNDADGLQAILNKLLALTPLRAQPSRQGGITYYTIRIPSAQKTVDIGYAFVDGYLVLASSQDGVAEAVRLHRSGESLAQSSQFLASMPPGQGSETSALFYEDPTAVLALSMGQAFPGLAQSLSQETAEPAPAVVRLYGEESAIRETSLSPRVDAAGILVAAAIAIPNLLRARIAADESSAVATIRMANRAQSTYSNTYPQRGFAPDWATLGPDPGASGRPSAEHASIMDATFGNASCTKGTWCTKSGYQFSLTASCKKQSCDEFLVIGIPVSSSTGSRSFCSTSDMVVRFKTGTPLTSPLGVSDCQAWSPLQ
jgi:type II secretory pathway pseudopilin PulG